MRRHKGLEAALARLAEDFANTTEPYAIVAGSNRPDMYWVDAGFLAELRPGGPGE